MYLDFYSNNHPFSNFYPSDMLINGQIWSTVEHYFQAQKFDINSKEYKLIIDNESPAFAKKIGQGGKLRKDWEYVKEDIMYTALCEKFKIPEFKKYLLDTGDSIIRKNSESDSYWGIGKNGQGKNRLGILLMKIRSS
jgi:ribA/ribD-fused uncharacterized protein